MDLFVVPTISFRLLYGLLILHHDRRQIHPPPSGDEHSGSSDRAAVAVAEWIL
jgi:hypothetical protein